MIARTGTGFPKSPRTRMTAPRSGPVALREVEERIKGFLQDDCHETQDVPHRRGALETRSLLSGLTYSLTTSQAVYQVGEPVQMTLTETNTSSSPILGAWGGVGSIGFTVQRNGIVATAFLTDPMIVPWPL
jgi:hypothetical protein